MGLAYDEWDLDYYTALFRDDMKRDPTNVELFDIAQSNSEHSRHWFFRGYIVIDGQPVRCLALLSAIHPDALVVAEMTATAAKLGSLMKGHRDLPATSVAPRSDRGQDTDFAGHCACVISRMPYTRSGPYCAVTFIRTTGPRFFAAFSHPPPSNPAFSSHTTDERHTVQHRQDALEAEPQ